MRGAVYGRGIGLAIALVLALLAVATSTHALAVSQRGSDPFLIGPPDEIVAPVSSSDRSDDGSKTTATSTPTARSSRASTASSTSNSAPANSLASAASSSASSVSTSVLTSSSSSSSSSTPSDSTLPSSTGATKQPDSLKYLVPVFLFILITLGGWLFSRWYARRKVDEYEEEEYERGKWKQLKDADAIDEKDPWYSGDSDRDANEVHWQDVELVPARSSGAISAAGRGWGWRSTMNAWKSARGRAEAQSDEETDEMGQRRTIKLVPALPSAATYQTLPDLPGRPMVAIAEERGSIRALRDKLVSLTYRDREQTPAGKLNRNRSPNKRRGGGGKDVAPPEAPAWIQPRATSPTQVLSPPMQPHLFFHPGPSAMSLYGILTHTAGSESGSDYGTDDESHVTRSRLADPRPSHARFPTIPSTATALANSYTALPPGRSPRGGGSSGSTESIVDGDTDVIRTPTRRSQLERAKTAATPSSRLEPAPMLRRSTALPDIVDTPATLKMARSATTRDRPTTSGLSPSPFRAKRSKARKKAEKAHDKVEDILKASWSDRALASPTSCMSLDGAVAGAVGAGRGMSPGVEDAAVFGGNGGGIEQRLAMLKKLGT